MEHALIYCRVSTEEQAEDGHHSLATQLKLCKRAIEESNKFKLIDDGVFEDPGRSATNMNRPGLQDMLLKIPDDKTIRAVFIQDTDRLARNALDHMQIKAIMKKHDVELFSVSQPGITDSPEGNFIDLVIAGVNQLQSQITSRKTLKSLEQKFWDGWWPTGVASGYLNAGDPSDEKKRIITVDEERAPLIQEAFNMYVTGDYSVYEVRDALYKKGFRTHAGKRLAHSKMIEILKNQFYYGEMRWRGLVGVGKHKPLITKEIWERVQLVMAEHTRYACRRQKFNFILRGLTYCANCGQRYTAEHHQKKNKSYYHCNRSGDQIKCHDKYVEVWDLEQQIADLFKYIEFTPSFKERLVARIEKIYGSRKEVINKEKRSLNTQKMLLEKKRDVAEEKLFASLITDDDFTRVKVKIKEQVEAIQDEIYKQDKKLNMRIDELQDVLLFARNAYEAFVKAPAELQRLFLGLYWDRFEVTDKKVVTVLPTPIIRGLMLAEDMVFTKKYQEIREPRIITDMAVEFTPVIAGKSKSKLASKTQKSRRNAEIPVMVSNQPESVILDTVWGAVVEDVRTVFERRNDATLYIPD